MFFEKNWLTRGTATTLALNVDKAFLNIQWFNRSGHIMPYSDGGADGGRLARRRRLDARFDRHCHCRPDHHLPVRNRTRDPGRAGGRCRRLFRSGVILNGGDAIERLAEADTSSSTRPAR